MERLNEQEQRDLIGAVEQAIVFSRTMHPNEAILKVASDRQYNPQFVSRMVEAFNKSKTVHVLKEAKGDDRAKPFDIADAAWVLQKMYAPEMTKAAAEVPQVTRERSLVRQTQVMQKAASALQPAPVKDPELRARMMKQAEDAYFYVCKKVMDQLHTNVQEQKYAFDQALDRIVTEIAPMPEHYLQKVARYIINGYPTTGPALLAVLSNRLSRPLPELQKTANAVVFPNREPYISISALYTAAEKMAKAEIEEQTFEKSAEEGFISGVASRALAETLAGMGVAPETMAEAGAASRKEKGEDVLDPNFYNKLKELDVKRAFLSLVLYDPDLKQYGMSELRKSYNDVVSTVPNAYQNPVVLKNMMLRNLQSSGVKDPYELKQELEIGKTMDETTQNREKMQLERDKLKALTKPSESRPEPFQFGRLPLVAPVGEAIGSMGTITEKALKVRQEEEEREAKKKEQTNKAKS